MTEGLCGRHSFYCKTYAKSYCSNNPSVKNLKIFDSSLYTREPWALLRQCDKLEFVGEQMTKHIANILTGCRIFGSILLLFFPAFSMAFYIIYLFCGFSDMVDGTIARKTNSTSKFGSQLDTIADLIFVVVSLFKLLPTIHIPQWLWIWGGVIAVIKISNIIWGYVSKKQFISMHTIMNKVTGLLLFLLPLTISFVELKYTAIVVCSVATFSAIQEGYYVRKGRETV